MKTVDVTAPGFSARGNGSTDDSAAFQRAVDALVNTGGTIWVPPNRVYKISSTVTIRSHKPIFIQSEMGGFNNPFVTSGQGCIVPGAVGASSAVFRWQKPADAGTALDAGSGGAIGLVFMGSQDHGSANGYGRTTASSIGSCLQVDNALNFVIDRCQFYAIVGRAFLSGEFIGKMTINGCDSQHCGDTSKPLWDLAASTSGEYWFSDSEFEINYGAEYIKLAANNGCDLERVRFEADNAITTDQTFVDATLGALEADHCAFRRCGTVAVKLGTDSPRLRNSTFHEQTGGTAAFITLTSGAQNAVFENLQFYGVSGQTGTVLDIAANQCKLRGIEMYVTGKLVVSAAFCQLSDIYVRNSLVPSGSYAVDLGAYNTLCGGTIKGASGSNIAGGGITAAGASKITDVDLYYIDEKGIKTTGAATVANCYGEAVTGTLFDLAAGTRASNNGGYTATATAIDDSTGFSATVTHNAESGIITYPDDGAGTSHILHLNNALINTSSRVFVSFSRGTDSTGPYYTFKEAQCSAGLCDIAWFSDAALNGTVKISYEVRN